MQPEIGGPLQRHVEPYMEDCRGPANFWLSVKMAALVRSLSPAEASATKMM
jgi:hypothetical protein